MPTPTKGPRLGGSPAHQRMILANLATSLFEHGRITTTEAKARRLRPFAERLISKAKRDDLHSRRQVLSVIRDKGIVHSLFTEIGPNYATRPGGYTRITKVGPRKGDNAPMAVIELVEAREFATRTSTPGAAGATAANDSAESTEPSPEPAPAEEATPADEQTTESSTVDEEARDEEAADTDSAPASTEPAEPAAAEADGTDADESDADGAEADSTEADSTEADGTDVDSTGADSSAAGDEEPKG